MNGSLVQTTSQISDDERNPNIKERCCFAEAGLNVKIMRSINMIQMRIKK